MSPIGTGPGLGNDDLLARLLGLGLPRRRRRRRRRTYGSSGRSPLRAPSGPIRFEVLESFSPTRGRVGDAPGDEVDRRARAPVPARRDRGPSIVSAPREQLVGARGAAPLGEDDQLAPRRRAASRTSRSATSRLRSRSAVELSCTAAARSPFPFLGQPGSEVRAEFRLTDQSILRSAATRFQCHLGSAAGTDAFEAAPFRAARIAAVRRSSQALPEGRARDRRSPLARGDQVRALARIPSAPPRSFPPELSR